MAANSLSHRVRSAVNTLWTQPEAVPSRAYHLAAVVLALLAGSVAVLMMLRFSHPSGGDPGQWLSMANLYLGTGRADFSPYQYPPLLFFLLSAMLAISGDPITALYATDFVMCAALTLSCYFAFSAATKDRRGALLFAVLAGFSQPIWEMLSWGGYPNLFSFSFFVPACAFLVVCAQPDARRRDFALLGLFTGLTFLAHPLSSVLLVFCGAGFVCLGLLGGLGYKWLLRAAPVAVPIALGLYLPYFALFLSIPGGGPTYVSGEETYSIGAALEPLIPRSIKPFFPGGAVSTHVVLIGASALSLLCLRGLIRTAETPPWLRWLLPGEALRSRSNVFLFLGALVPPLLLPVLMYTGGYYTDFARLLYFPVFPLAAGAAAVVSRLTTREGACGFLEWWGSRRPRAPTQSAPRSRSLLSNEAVAGLVALLLVVSVCLAGVRYFEGSSQHYANFDDPEDLELARWARSSTDLDDLLLLSPEDANQFAVKWLGGLSGRESLGYELPSALFYQSERILSYEVYQFFHYRYAIANGFMEVGTPGAQDAAGFQVRVAIINVFNAFPVVDLLANQTWLVFANGSQVNVGNFSERSVVSDFADAAHPRITYVASDSATGANVSATLTLLERHAQISFAAGSTQQPVASLSLSMSVPQPICDFEVGAGFALLRVRTEAVCTPARILVGGTGVPVLSNQSLSFSLDVSSSATATVTVENLGGSSGLGTALTTFDGSRFLQDREVNYIILLKEGSAFWEIIRGAYAFPVAFENARYIVYEVPTAPG